MPRQHPPIPLPEPPALYLKRLQKRLDAIAAGKTEFNRVTERLRIEQICALTPQAKGRVERANQTLQDRLVKEMRLRAISTIEEAEAFFPAFIASFNTKFAVAARDPADAHRPWTVGAAALEEALAWREERVLSKALTFSCGGVRYAVQTKGPGVALRGAKVLLLHFMDGSMQVRYKDRLLPCTAYRTYGVASPVADEKTLDVRVNAVIARLVRPSPTASEAPPLSKAPGCG